MVKVLEQCKCRIKTIRYLKYRYLLFLLMLLVILITGYLVYSQNIEDFAGDSQKQPMDLTNLQHLLYQYHHATSEETARAGRNAIKLRKIVFKNKPF